MPTLALLAALALTDATRPVSPAPPEPRLTLDAFEAVATYNHEVVGARLAAAPLPGVPSE